MINTCRTAPAQHQLCLIQHNWVIQGDFTLFWLWLKHLWPVTQGVTGHFLRQVTEISIFMPNIPSKQKRVCFLLRRPRLIFALCPYCLTITIGQLNNQYGAVEWVDITSVIAYLYETNSTEIGYHSVLKDLMFDPVIEKAIIKQSLLPASDWFHFSNFTQELTMRNKKTNKANGRKSSNNLPVPRIIITSASQQDITPEELGTPHIESLNNADNSNMETISLRTGENVTRYTQNKRAIIRSVWGVSLGFFCTWNAVSGLSIIQSSIIGQVGVIGLSLQFSFSIIGCAVVAPIVTKLFGYKHCMIAGFICVMLWEASNMYPSYWTVVPGSILSGIAMGPMFAGQGSYLTLQGNNYAQLSDEEPEAVIGRFFGIFFFSLLLCK